MFTTSRQAAAGLCLGGGAWDLWTKAEALDLSGNWHPLRSRVEPRPVKEGLEDEGLSYEGPPPTQFMETWEFPSCPEPSAWVRVRIWATRGYINCGCVEFKLPNDYVWREGSLEEATNEFHPQEWLNDELFRAGLQEDADYAKDLITQGADPNSCDSEGRSLLTIVCQNDRQRDIANSWSNLLDRGVVMADQIARMAATSEDRHRRMVRLLVEHGANMNARAEFGWTPLILAARAGDVESVKYLLGRGADPNIKDEEGDPIIEPIERTKSTNRLEIIKILKRAQATH